MPATIDSFSQVTDIPADGYCAGYTLFPGCVIAGCNGEYDQYNADTWATHVLEWCTEEFADLGPITAVSYSATNSGDTGGRFWFGYAFASIATIDDFEKDGDVKELKVFTRAL
ncbi:hypothetical protein ONZ45_g10375 [Pleurotus djamor]|nr:hypothetical protein ONZ45_g10375 [Pleurotus djamor]